MAGTRKNSTFSLHIRENEVSDTHERDVRRASQEVVPSPLKAEQQGQEEGNAKWIK